MTHFDRLKQQVYELDALVRLQRSLRFALRAFWLGLAGTLVGWGINALTGWLPNPGTWLLVGLGAALFPIAAMLVTLYPVLVALPPQSAWVWNVDRLAGLREQFSTAWEVVQKNQTGLINDLLVQDVLAVLPRVRGPLLKGGWLQKVDLAATLLFSFLSCALLSALLLRPAPKPVLDAPARVIPLTAPTQSPTQAPGAAEQSPAGQSPQAGNTRDGSQSGESPTNPQESPSQQPGPDSASGSNADRNATADTLRQLGAELSRQAGTYDLGQALENLDMNRAADALDELNGQLNDLSPESRENLAQALNNAAQALDQAGEPGLAQDMRAAAGSLGGDRQAPSPALGQVADDLRQLADGMQASGSSGGGAGSGKSAESGNPEPFNRLPNQGGNMELPQDDSTQSGLLSPASPDAAGEGTASGALDAAARPGAEPIQSPLLPNTFLWKWRDVVSQYFQR